MKNLIDKIKNFILNLQEKVSSIGTITISGILFWLVIVPYMFLLIGTLIILVDILTLLDSIREVSMKTKVLEFFKNFVSFVKDKAKDLITGFMFFCIFMIVEKVSMIVLVPVLILCLAIVINEYIFWKNPNELNFTAI